MPPPLIPIVIGVTGKRELAGEQEARVRRLLQEALSKLEKDFQDSPLVLATGLAKGADLLAAEVALAQDGARWTVVGILPFAVELFLEDFKAPADLKSRQRFESILATPSERFLLKVLKPLRKPPDERSKRGEPFRPEELHRTEDKPNLVRRDHYEQVGLVIADRCGLLLAVMPEGEEPDKVGGTARIVRHKRDGRLDDEARKVAEASEEIAPPEPLDREARGLVQILDPGPKEPAGKEGSRQPPDKGNDQQPINKKKLAGRKDDQRYAWMTLDRIEAFNQRVRGPRAAASAVPAASKLVDATKDDPTRDYGRRLRGELSRIQRRTKSRLSWSMFMLAVLFVLSVVVLETHAKLDLRSLFPDLDERLPFAGYALTFLCGLGLFIWVSRNELPAFTEDYRGAAEAMRVQLEWWRLGMREPKHRVDRYYLVGGEGHFAVLRRGIKAAIDAAVLLAPGRAPPGQPLELQLEETGSPPQGKVRELFLRIRKRLSRIQEFLLRIVGRQKKGPERSDFWIPGQISYFENNSDERHRRAIRRSSLAWYLFQLSVGVGLAILLLQNLGTPKDDALNRLALESREHPWLPFLPFVGAVLWGFFFWAFVRAPQQDPPPPNAPWRRRLYHRLRYRSILGTRGQHSGKRGWTIAVLLGLAMVPAVHVLRQWFLADAASYTTEKVSLVLMIVLAAVSGAVRFVLERSALEAEAVSYREALQRFNAAHERALEARKKAGSGAGATAAILKADQDLGFELGRVALAENEAWLRAHRQRPFEPVP